MMQPRAAPPPTSLMTAICHAHNLNRDLDQPRPYGIRVSLAPGDSFMRLLGTDWQQEHWYATASERDQALADMASEHLYSRRGDRPTLQFEPVLRRAP
jgi:hypothetical protein